MKKIIFLSIILSLSLLLTACFNKEAKNQEVESSAKKTELPKSISDWLIGTTEVSCRVLEKTEEGEENITIKFKNGKVRVEGFPYYGVYGDSSGQNGVAVFDKENIYIWSGQEGIFFNQKEMEEYSRDFVDDEHFDQSDYSWQDWVKEAEEEGYEYNCQKENLADDLFLPPADVNFVNMMDMLAGFQDFFKDLNFEDSIQNQEDWEEKIEELMQR